jgi:putative heme-binding domain-containing protein
MALFRVASFTVVLIGLFIWGGGGITRVSGEGAPAALGEGLSVENGEQIFWGPGKCSTCHSIGSRGSSVRGPNLGQSAVGPEMAVRAVERAGERSAALGRELTGTEYLIESIASPSAFVVDGFKDEMPTVYEPPISLGPDQIGSVILYLQSQGGSPDPSAVVLPPEIRAAAGRASDVEPWAPYMDGDSVAGRELFFDLEGPAPCAKCHMIEAEGGEVGPDLTSVAGTRTAEFIVESIVSPSVEIAGGYESVLIQTSDGRLLDGVVRRETQDSVWLVTADGVEFALSSGSIARRRTQELSLMPGDMAEVLSVTDLHDLLAYLRTRL